MAWLLVVLLLVLLIAKAKSKSDLEERVSRIEAYLVKETSSTAKSGFASPLPQLEPPTATTKETKGSALPIAPQANTDALAWLAKDWPMKAGALLILLAAGWFVSYAFANNWIGEEGRIAVGVIVGMLFMGAGHWRSRASVDQGVVLYLIGGTTIHLTLFAARNAYDMFTPEVVLAAMFLVSVYLAIVSARLKNFPLAAWGLFLAAVAPFLVDADTDTIAGLLIYSGVVAAGTLALSIFTSWRKLLLLSILPYALYSFMGMLDFGSTEKPTLFLIANGFALAFAGAGVWYSHRLHSKGEGKYDLLAGALNALVLFGWIMSAAPEGIDSLFFALWGLLFSLIAFYQFEYRKEMVPALVYAGLGTLFVGIATAIELDGAALTIAFALEAAVLGFGALQLFRTPGVGAWVGAVFVPSVILSMASMLSPLWQEGVFHKDAFVIILMGSLLALLSAFAYQFRSTALMPMKEEYDSVFHTAAVGTWLYWLSFVWLAAHAVFAYDAGTAISLAIYAVIGIAAYFYSPNKNVRIAGGILIGAVIGRLLFVEVWQMDIAGRIITFFGIGGLLLLATIARKSLGAREVPKP